MGTDTLGKPAGVFSVGLVVGFVAGVLICLWWSGSAESMQIQVTGPNDTTLHLAVEGFTLDQQALLDTIYDDQFARDGLMGWLSDKRIFKTSDPSLAEALNTALCDPIPTTPLSAQIAAARKCAELPVALRLRRLADQRHTPFHYIGQIVRVGIPGNESNRPQDPRGQRVR